MRGAWAMLLVAACGGTVARAGPGDAGSGANNGDANPASPAASSCATLSSCCSTLPAPGQMTCDATVTAGNASDCSAYLAGIQATGGCVSAATPPGPNDAGSDSRSMSGGAPIDATRPDAAEDSGVVLASFDLVVNGEIQHPMTCPFADWEYASPPNGSGPASCATPGMCVGVMSVVLVNTGPHPMAYIASAEWLAPGYQPGVPTGEPNQLTGTLAPGAQVDITSAYSGGITAILGCADPFSLGTNTTDEGAIPWPLGVAGSGGAPTMQVAEIEVFASCSPASRFW